MSGEKSYVKEQNQPSKSRDRIGFTRRCMNQVASHLARRRALGELSKVNGFTGRKTVGLRS